MKLNPFYRTLATLVFGISSLNASAALVLAGSGTTVDFYYDDASWSNATASVVNDRITFAFGPALQALAAESTVALQDGGSPSGAAVVIAVARSGYSFSGAPLGLVAGVAGSYALASSGGSVSAISSASVHEGSFAGGVFSSAQYLGDVFADATAVSDDVAATSGAFGVDGVAPSGSALVGPALALFDVFYSVVASQDATGESAISLDSLSYTVSANAMSTVPEPGSLVLLLSALGLAGWAGRGQTTRSGRSNRAV